MNASLASNCDFKSSTDGKSGVIEVRIPDYVLDVSIVEVGMVLGKTLAAVTIVAGTPTSPSGGPLGWPLCSRARFWIRSAFRALFGPGAVFTLFGRVPSESLSSSDSSVLSFSSSFPTITFVRFKLPCGFFGHRDVFGLLDRVPIHLLLQYHFGPHHSKNIEYDLIPIHICTLVQDLIHLYAPLYKVRT
jgi:hypothetical protein